MLKLQRPAILADRAHRALIVSTSQFRPDLQGDLNLAADLAGKLFNNLFYNHSNTLIDALGVHLQAPVVVR
jgi:hypothetical protein